jgi:hypothetical protein
LKAHRLVYHSTLDSGVLKKKTKKLWDAAWVFEVQGSGFRVWGLGFGHRGSGLKVKGRL